MAKFHSLTISQITRETENSVSIAFKVPDDLKTVFQYQAGQYITFKLTIEGEEIRRSYSLCSSPALNEILRVGIKKVEGGRASNYFNSVAKVGDIIQVMSPMGHFKTEINSDQRKNYVAFAAGSGITPVLSILKTVLEIEKDSTFTLFYGNRYAHSIMFKNELDHIVTKYAPRFKIYNVLSRPEHQDPLFSGRIDKEKAGQLLSTYTHLPTTDVYFLCGPYDMIMDISAWLKENEVNKEKILFELFSTPTEPSEKIKSESTESPLTGKSKLTVNLDGEKSEFEMSPVNSILEIGIDAGLDVPYACQGGSCCTCKAMLVKGKVKMDANYALSDAEVEQGYILTCQSHPLTEEVEVDYDR